MYQFWLDRPAVTVDSGVMELRDEEGKRKIDMETDPAYRLEIQRPIQGSKISRNDLHNERIPWSALVFLYSISTTDPTDPADPAS